MRVAGDSLKLQSNTSDENYLIATKDGSVDVYHNNGKKFASHSNGLSIKNEAGGSSSSLFIFGPEGESAEIQMNADDGDDNADYFRLIHVASDNSWRLQNYGSGSWGTNIEANPSGNVELYHNAARKLMTNSSGIQIGSTTAPFLIENTTSGDGSQDIARMGLNRDNTSTSDRQMWSQITVASDYAKFNVYARSANDTGTAGNFLEIDAVNGNVDIPRDSCELQIGASNDLKL